MKYSRLIAGLVILISMLIFLGSSPSHESEACFDFCNDMLGSWGYIEVWNDTIYHIGIIMFYTESSGDTFVLKHDPGMLRKGFVDGVVAIAAYIIDPLTKKWKFHKWYRVVVTAPETSVVRVKGGSLF